MRGFYILILSLIALATGVAVTAQEADAPSEAVDSTNAVTPAAGGDAEQDEDESDDESGATEEPDDTDLDLQTYEEDEDDFVPTEEVPADQAIPFPSDI